MVSLRKLQSLLCYEMVETDASGKKISAFEKKVLGLKKEKE